jgi:hypothetical protein
MISKEAPIFSVSRFETGYARTILLPSSYHIRIGSGFSTMQLAELALYFNGARFLRNSLLELISLSLSLTASAISSHLVSLMCALSVLHVQVPQQNYL